MALSAVLLEVEGAIAHGIGDALFEWMGYDENCRPVTTTFARYLLPAATETPHIKLLYQQRPSPLNPLGAKGVGEARTIAVAPAIAAALRSADPARPAVRRDGGWTGGRDAGRVAVGVSRRQTGRQSALGTSKLS